MRIFVILLSTCVALSTSQCDDVYGTYLNCIKGELDKNYQSLETDFREQYIDLAMSCFTSDQTQLSQKCFIKGRDVFFEAFTADGPLRQCRMCQTVARVIEKLFTSPDVSAATMKCIRGNVTEAIGKEIGACIKGKIASFNMPALPDFDESSYPYRKDIVNTTSAFIVASSGLQRCQANRKDDNRRKKRGAFDTTNTCMNARVVDGKPIWASHCNIMGSCRRPIAANCKATFGQVETAACACIEEKRQKINGIITGAADQIKTVIGETVAKAGDTCTTATEADPDLKLQNYKECRCTAIINGVIDNNSGQVDIRAYFQRAVGCAQISQDQKDQFTIDKLIEMGCRRVGRPGDSGEQGAKELVIGVDFILKLFDAMVARVTRFCPGTQCMNPAV